MAYITYDQTSNNSDKHSPHTLCRSCPRAGRLPVPPETESCICAVCDMCCAWENSLKLQLHFDINSSILYCLLRFILQSDVWIWIKVTDNLANLTQFTSDLELKIETIRNTLHDRIAAMDTAFEKFQNIVLITKPSSDSSPISPQNQVCDYDVNILLTKVSSINRELRANNVVIHGIRQDTGKETHNQALDFLKHKLNLRIQPLESKRLGKSTPEHTAPLLLKFQSRLEKLQLLKRCYLLKGTHISVQDDLCEEDRAERKRKLPNFKELKALNRNVHFRGPDLFVDNKLYPCWSTTRDAFPLHFNIPPPPIHLQLPLQRSQNRDPFHLHCQPNPSPTPENYPRKLPPNSLQGTPAPAPRMTKDFTNLN